MVKWRLIKSLPGSGHQNMELDQQLFQDFEKGVIPRTLRIYSWNPPCISLGYSQDIEENIDIYKTFDKGWEIIKRPTGGGIVFHSLSEVTYSVVTSQNELEQGLVASYIQISEAVAAGLNKLNIGAEINKAAVKLDRPDLCFSYPAEYEIVVSGKKLVGSAQKRGKKALLQQGSIFIRHDFSDVLEVLKKPVDKDFYLNRAVAVEDILKREVAFDELADALVSGFKEKLEVKF